MTQLKVLAVDDEPDQLAMLVDLLKDQGYQIDTAPDGLAALTHVQDFQPDLILVDANMPRMNGFTFCEALRQCATTAAIPVIMLTGLYSHLGKLNSFAHGSRAYLVKPFNPDELLDVIRNILNLPDPPRGQQSDALRKKRKPNRS